MIDSRTVEFIQEQGLDFVLGSALMHIVAASKLKGLDRDEEIESAAKCLDLALEQGEPIAPAPHKRTSRRATPESEVVMFKPEPADPQEPRICLNCDIRKGPTAFTKGENVCKKCHRETERKLNA